MAVVDPFPDDRRVVAAPAWWREKAGDPAHLGAGMGYTLTAAAHHSRMHGAKHGPWQLVLANMEYWLARSFDGEPGVAPLLLPVRRGGPGPWVSMRWYEVMQHLALDRFDVDAREARRAALRRYWRIVDSFAAAGYMRHGDVVELEASKKPGDPSILRGGPAGG